MRCGIEGMFLLLCGILQLIGDVYLLNCQRYSKHQAIKTGQLNDKVLCRIRDLGAGARICLNGLQPSGMYCATGVCNVFGFNCDGICFSGNDTTDQPEDFDLLCDTKSFNEREKLCHYYQQEEKNLENHKNSKRQVPSSDELEKQTGSTKEPVSSSVGFENHNVTIMEDVPSSDKLEKHTNITKEVSSTVEFENHKVTMVEDVPSSDKLEKHTNITKEVSSTVELENYNVTIMEDVPSSDKLEKHTNITKEVSSTVELENHNITLVEEVSSSDKLEKHTNITKEMSTPVEFENHKVTMVENVQIVEVKPSSDEIDLTEAPPRQINGFVPKPSILKKYGWVKCKSLEFNIQNVCPWQWHKFKNGTEGICSYPCESEPVNI